MTVDPHGLPILGASDVEPVPRALLLVDVASASAIDAPDAVAVPVAPSALNGGARVVGDAGEVALWRSLFVMVDTVAAELRELRAALVAAGVITRADGPE